MYTHEENILTQGKPLDQTGKALVMLHGRGASASSIVALAGQLEVGEYSIFAPQATNHSWYPQSFMAPEGQNQPALDSALAVLDEVVRYIKHQGVESNHIYLLGFSQGACLTAEYASRHAQRFGGVFVFTGGLIGEKVIEEKYAGDFAGTPILITTGDPDPHVPVSRVEETVRVMQDLKAEITKKIFKGRPHTILEEEIELAKAILAQG